MAIHVRARSEDRKGPRVPECNRTSLPGVREAPVGQHYRTNSFLDLTDAWETLEDRRVGFGWRGAMSAELKAEAMCGEDTANGADSQ